MNYTLMNKNRPLAEIELADNGYIIGINKIQDPAAFPVGVIDDSLKNTVGRLNSWWHGRAIPASRDGLQFVLHTYGIENTAALAVKSLGLSLSDQYWIKPEGSDITWQDVNFFTNDFSKDLGEAFFSRGSSKPDINPMTPDANSNGWLKKKWVIAGGEKYLAKAGSAPLMQQPYNEVAAAQIMSALGIEHVDYKLISEHGRPLSLCRNFITEDTEFVPAYLIRNVLPKSNNDNDYTHFLKCADKLQIPKVREHLDQLLAIDFIIENTDRHFGNFGFIRDVNTLKFIGPAPIFDSGTSLWCEALNSEIGSWQKCMPFKETHKEQRKLIFSYKLNYEALTECAETVHNVLNTSPYLDPERVEKITAAVDNRSRLLANHISSELKNSMNYKAAYDFFRINNEAVKNGKQSTDLDIYKAMLKFGLSEGRCNSIIEQSPAFKNSLTKYINFKESLSSILHRNNDLEL